VICESDADCRYYGSVLDSLAEAENSAADILFAHCGGKHRLKVAVEALRAVAVPTAVIADFDILKDENVLRPLLEALGGSWLVFERDWRIVKSSLDTGGQAPSVAYVKEETNKLLDAVTTPTLSRDDEAKLRVLLRSSSAWDAAKRGGVSSLPQGDVSNAGERLITSLKTVGLFIVRVGELERWVPEIGGHGPAWVTGVLEHGKHTDKSNSAPREFVRGIWKYLLRSGSVATTRSVSR
jgi:hypothetical protein